MVRTTFEAELGKLQRELLEMGKMVDKAISRSIEALKARDFEASKQIIADDFIINEKRFALEEKCLQLIATQQPMARDLRTIAAVMEIATELERMADHAKGIAKINIMIGDEPLLKPLIDVPRMADKAREMLQRALEAFVNRDLKEARSIPEEDDEVDGLYNQVYRELLLIMMQDPRTITQATYLLWVAHNLERIADRVSNICERVIFIITGEMVELDAG
ncbi:MAG: phosphate transport system regulatory protein PhoU [Chloroflexi bacterium]|nr:MAG: phosphate transport system regulatory protein PhoU [Chloroflexota bacterium]